MDVRAFGSIYGQSATLPYASGLSVAASGQNLTFPACRAIYVESRNKNADQVLSVILADSPGTPLQLDHIRTDVLLPLSCTAISGVTTVEHVYVLY